MHCSRYVCIDFQAIISITYFFIDNSLGPLARDSPCIIHVLETCRDMKETYCKTKFCASSWLITEINILRCSAVSRMSKLDRSVAASSNNLFKGLPSRLLPFDLQFSNIFVTLLLFSIATCRSQSDLYLPSFLPAASTFMCQLFC